MRISDWSSDVCSSDLYERGTTACVNASVQPVLHRYIERLNGELKSKGFRRDLLVMQGNGGTIAAGIVSEAAVNPVMSGPDRQSVGSGKSVSVRVDLGGRRICNKKKNNR